MDLSSLDGGSSAPTGSAGIEGGGTSAPSSGAPEGSAPQSLAKPTSTQAPGQAPSLTDLDKLEKFRFEGREWTPKDLRKAYLRQQDYSQKTAELAKTREYVDNFPADLQRVIQDRKLLTRLSEVYPAEYVERAKEIIAAIDQRHPQSEPGNEQQPQVDPRVQALEEKLQRWEQVQEAMETEKISSWLNTEYERLSKKYPDADPDLVTAYARYASDNKVKVTGEVLERLFKQVDDRTRERYDARRRTQNTAQLTAGKEGRDIGAGGGAPIPAPKKYKTIKEASEAFEAHVRNQDR